MKNGTELKQAILPMNYDTYVFDLYGTLVDINTKEDDPMVWEKMALFYGYYDAAYRPEELQNAYKELVHGKEKELKKTLETDPRYPHEASPEIEITEVFLELFKRKGVEVSKELAVHAGQFFRILSTVYVRTYPGTESMLRTLKMAEKKIYLLSNAQRIFTEYEMHVLKIAQYFDGILISSDFQTKKPDRRFFDILINQYQIDVNKSLFIGNDSKTDIAGAQAAGFSTYYVKSNISPEGDKALHATYYLNDFSAWE